jgi:aminocarboxymuconate-semialdehyde decarboxylase
MIVDIYTHIFPTKFFEAWQKLAPQLGNIAKRIGQVEPVHNLDVRFKAMDRAGSDYCHIVSLPNPPIEDFATPELGAELCKLANDTMAEIVEKHRARFPAFVAAVPLHNLDFAMKEIDRAILQLGAKGIQIFTNVKGKPLDRPEFRPVFARMAELDLPIWLHPARTAAMTDYAAEKSSRFEIWWAFGWPYETQVACARLVFDGLFDRHPNIKIVTHHGGGGLPFFDGRIEEGFRTLGARTSDEDYSKVIPSLKKPLLDYFKMFYADTALMGGNIGIQASLDFFGPDRVVFATDAPFAPIVPTLEAVKRLELEPSYLERMNMDNAEKLLKMKFV